MILSNFVRDASTSIGLVRVAITSPEGTGRVGSTSSGLGRVGTVGVLGNRATELIYEVGGDAVKVLK
jgi:hypothetical protein